MLLLPQLVKTWLPSDNAACHENPSRPLSELAPRSQTPPLISFLEGLSDAITPDQYQGKTFSCGHVFSLRAILCCCNLFGDATWTPGPCLFGCAQPECNDIIEFPKLPDPSVVDGLAARLDLIEWSWRKDKPTEDDMNTVSLLREILSRIGHLSREPEPETDAELLQHEPSEASLMQTLVNMETEAFALMAKDWPMSGKLAVRGDQEYCADRAPRVPKAALSQLRYPMLSPGQDCVCTTPHEFEREARSWALTPAEADFDDNELKEEKKKKKSKKQPKTVRFGAPVVTQVQYFEPWYCDEYGPVTRSSDLATSLDDDWEIWKIDDPDGFAMEMEREMEDQESECSTLVDGPEVLDEMDSAYEVVEAEEVLDEMDRANEVSDDEILGEMERTGDSRDEDTMDEMEVFRGSEEDFF